jgi:osmotically-inducible protein OsmY
MKHGFTAAKFAIRPNVIYPREKKMYPNTTQYCVKKIRAMLAQDARINLGQSHIQVYSKSNSVVLEGSVPTISGKRLANTIARQIVNGDFPILDLLRVEGQAITDKELKDKVAQILGQEPVFADHTIVVRSDGDVEFMHDSKLNANRILASIENGIITLSGKVNSINHRRFVEVLMWWLPGCLQVNNTMEVVPPQLDNDDTLTNAIRMVLDKDPLVHASHLTIGAMSGVVELNGYLPNEEEHIFAIRDTWTVPGVNDVHDNINIGSFAA